MHTSTRVLESQIDWLTAAVHTHAKAVDWWGWALELQKKEVRDGQKPAPFTLGGYDGYRCGRVRYGRREAATLLQFSGDLADLNFGRVWTGHDTISRLDVAVTAQTLTYEPDHARRSYAEAVTTRMLHPALAQASLVQDADGGSTCYVGHRSSDRYLRIYNKQSEVSAAGDCEGALRYARCWRYELELKGRAAHQVAQQLTLTDDRGAWIAYYLHRHCLSHGIQPIFSPHGVHPLPRGFRRRSDRDSRLDWLTRTVAPTIRWLLDNTSEEELARRLGLTYHPTTVERADTSIDKLPWNV